MEMVGPPGLEPDDVGWGGLLGILSSHVLSRTVLRTYVMTYTIIPYGSNLKYCCYTDYQ